MGHAMLRVSVNLIDTLIFLWLAIRGFFLIAQGGGGYVLFWGCALICTAVFWKGLNKEGVVTSVQEFITFFTKR